jgi:hypothetical protein
MKYIIPLLFAFALAGGCKSSEEKAAPTPTSTEQQALTPATPVTPATAATPATPATTDPSAEANVPTATEFEAEANEQITDDNLEQELTAIEKEIGQ